MRPTSSTTQTSDGGRFTFSGLVPETYTITVEAANFKTLTMNDIRVQLKDVLGCLVCERHLRIRNSGPVGAEALGQSGCSGIDEFAGISCLIEKNFSWGVEFSYSWLATLQLPFPTSMSAAHFS